MAPGARSPWDNFLAITTASCLCEGAWIPRGGADSWASQYARVIVQMAGRRGRAGTDDVGHSYNHFVAFFEEFSRIDAMLEGVDSLPPADIQGEIDDPSCSHVKS